MKHTVTIELVLEGFKHVDTVSCKQLLWTVYKI